MRRIKLIGSILSLICSNVIGQNLIINPSFEDTIPFNFNTMTTCGPEASPPWFSGNSSPDYFNEIYGINCGWTIPSNPFGYEYARTGIGYAGFGSHPQHPAHELVSYTLLNPLIANHNYYFEFYISCADTAKYAHDGIGAIFTLDTLLITGYFSSSQIMNPFGNPITNTQGWTKISGSFIATGGERIITIGNLYDDSLTTYVINNSSAAWVSNMSYYYLDDVTLVDSTLLGLEDVQLIQNISVHPNPVTEILQVNLKKNIDGIIEIFNSSGQSIFKKSFNEFIDIPFSQHKSGVYLYSIRNQNGVLKTGTFVKQL